MQHAACVLGHLTKNNKQQTQEAVAQDASSRPFNEYQSNSNKQTVTLTYTSTSSVTKINPSYHRPLTRCNQHL
jgi:hypothetical protein